MKICRNPSLQSPTKKLNFCCCMCNLTGDGQMKLTFAAINSKDSLWTAEAVKEICEMDEKLVLTSNYIYTSTSCPSHSLGFYIGLLNNKQCNGITEGDMEETLRVLVPLCVISCSFLEHSHCTRCNNNEM